MLSRRVHYGFVSWIGQLGGLALALVIALAVPSGRVAPEDLAWGALSGAGTAVTMLFLNRGLSRGAMSTVLPISAVTGVALSVLCGVVLLSEQPGATAWVGIVIMLPALWLVSRGDRSTAGAVAVRDGFIASTGIAVQYVGLGMASAESGLWAIVAGRIAAVLILLPSALRARAAMRAGEARRPSRLDTAKALLIGAGAALALALYLLATREQLLAVAVALASLYPVIPVLIGLTLLRERVRAAQVVGLVAAAAATVLLSIA